MLNPTWLPMGDKANSTLLSADGLVKVFGEGDFAVQALRGISFDVRAHELLAIMGPSGSGKSTLLHLLGGMDLPTEGRLRFLGHDLDPRDDDAMVLLRRRRIGFIFQAFNLLPTLTAEQNVALPLLLDRVSRRQAYRKARDTLESLGLGHRLTHLPRAMSGGEQQRVAVARALVIDPTLILADEPTGNLDTENGRRVVEVLRRLVDELQQTVVVVTHDLSVAESADRVLLLRDGQIASDLAGRDCTRDTVSAALASPFGVRP